MNYFRTDMADELRRARPGELPGVRCGEEELRGLKVFAVDIYNKEGARRIGKPEGRYYTLRLPRWFSRGSEEYGATVEALSELIKRCLPEGFDPVFVAALGNPDITPDALGSLAAEAVLVTRHLKEKEPEPFAGFASVALCRPGVLGTTGIESARQVATLCRELRPRLVVVIDALAGSEPEQLCRSVQVSNAGIAPGSGVGNDRQELSAATLGVPVLSIGMPTVIDAGLFGGEKVDGMFVTPRDVDSLVRAGGRLIGSALNLALHPGLDLGTMEALLG